MMRRPFRIRSLAPRGSLVPTAVTMLVASVAIEGCSANADSSEPSEAEHAALRRLSPGEIVGTLLFGETSAPVAYTETPLYRAFRIRANAGTTIDAWVRAAGLGDARAFLLGSDFTTIKDADDSDGTRDAHLVASIAKTGDYYIAFRDKFRERGSFTVALNAPRAAPPEAEVDSLLGLPTSLPITLCNVPTDRAEQLTFRRAGTRMFLESGGALIPISEDGSFSEQVSTQPSYTRFVEGTLTLEDGVLSVRYVHRTESFYTTDAGRRSHLSTRTDESLGEVNVETQTAAPCNPERLSVVLFGTIESSIYAGPMPTNLILKFKKYFNRLYVTVEGELGGEILNAPLTSARTLDRSRQLPHGAERVSITIANGLIELKSFHSSDDYWSETVVRGFVSL